MDSFRYYFLKKYNRNYDVADMITYFQANPYIVFDRVNDDRIFNYHHPLFNFNAKFILASRSVVPNLDKISSDSFDINLYLEFDLILPTYFVEILLDIVEEIAKKFKLIIYNQAFNDAIPFNRNILIKTFIAWKKAYKEDKEESIAPFKTMDEQTLASVYSYILRRNSIELMFDKNKYQISKYDFLSSEKSRTAFVSINWNGSEPIIIPPAVDILYYDDGKNKKYIPYNELFNKISKLLKPIDGFGVIQLIEAKNVSKVKKIIIKTKFSPLTVALKKIELDKILDV